MSPRRVLDVRVVIFFPNICPACNSTARHQIIPSSPEVETFRCDSCGHEWSTPAPTPLRPIPDAVLPRRRRWFRKRNVSR